MDIKFLKNKLRKKLLPLRQNHDEYSFFKNNEAIIKNIRNLLNTLYIKAEIPNFNNVNYSELEFTNTGNKLALYWPIKGEPDLLKLTINSDWYISLPKLYGLDMKMIRYKCGSAVELSKFGQVYQPKNDEEIIPKIMIVPGLAFSISGRRLGFGFGHYDGYIAKINQFSKIITIGVCFHDYLYEFLPYDDRDMRFDYIITDKTFIRL